MSISGNPFNPLHFLNPPKNPVNFELSFDSFPEESSCGSSNLAEDPKRINDSENSQEISPEQKASDSSEINEKSKNNETFLLFSTLFI